MKKITEKMAQGLLKKSESSAVKTTGYYCRWWLAEPKVPKKLLKKTAQK